MNILFDRYGAQVQAQLQSHDRLTGLFTTIESAGYSYSIADGELSSSVLDGVDVLVLTTRMTRAYSTTELSAITDFVTNGGGLWCMANHAGFSLNMIDDNFVRYVSAVSSTYWTAYEAAAYSKTSRPTEVPLTGDNLADHPTIVGNDGWPLAPDSTSVTVTEVVTRSFCGVYPNAFSDPVCNLENLDGVVNTQNNTPVTPGVVWAVALNNSSLTGSGRVIVCADSGWLGNTDSTRPGPGEFQNGDNPQYALNTITWLGGN